MAEIVREQLGIPDCRSLIRLDKKVCHKGKTSSETRYFISSLDPDEVSASEFQDYILGHWEVENCLHLPKDRYFEEDKHTVRTEWGKAWTVLTNIAVSLAGSCERVKRRSVKFMSVVALIRALLQKNSDGNGERTAKSEGKRSPLNGK